jgi:phenylalanyl-tRNA synthetase beta chain
MKISLEWLNTYLPADCSAQQADELLMSQGFPIEGTIDFVEGPAAGDTQLDVEVTSNRGDCLSHIGVAREVAAGMGESLSMPTVDEPAAGGESVHTLTSVTVEQPGACPLYTARVIRGVKVGPSPDWLKRRLTAIGLRPVNNIVDITNIVLMEHGQPLHAFDFNKLAGHNIIVRYAQPGEAFRAIDGSQHKLSSDMLVIADSDRPQAVAGVMGGAESMVTDTTTDILLESAIFEPLTVRSTSRALKLASDSSFRFERGVDPAGVERASRAAAKLILEMAGGTLTPGVITVGEIPGETPTITLRPERVEQLLGISIAPEKITQLLGSIGIQRSGEADASGVLRFDPPSFRLDLEREVDLIEEIARLHGLDDIPTQPKIEIVARPPQPSVEARRAIDRVLVGHGYHETVTFSFMSEDHAAAFIPPDAEALLLNDERKKATPVLRPSIIPSLLACRKLNQDAGNSDIKLFETASTWAVRDGQTLETRRLCLLRDAQDGERAVRELRSVLQEMVEALAGPDAADWLSIEPVAPSDSFSTLAKVRLQSREIGRFGLISPSQLKLHGITTPQLAVELVADDLLSQYPPRPSVSSLPKYPGIERDLSVIVEETVGWQQIESTIRSADPALLERIEYLDVYRGKPIPPGRKSVSLRLLFRDLLQTLRHEQVDPQVQAVVRSLNEKLDAELRE